MTIGIPSYVVTSAGTRSSCEALPNADQATIDAEKLIAYILDPDNAVGRHKAHVFEAALGITREDWEYLRDAILRELPKHPVSVVRPPRHDKDHYTWEVMVPITGLNGRRLFVVTAWKMIDGRPRLVTALVAPKARQTSDEGPTL